jgi:hypothetical protein
MTLKTVRKTFIIISVCCLFAILVASGVYIISIPITNKANYERYNEDSLIVLRKFPYPFKAALAISNDIDNTETLEEFLEIQKFVNTKENTGMGKGIGLEIGSGFFFHEPPGNAIYYFAADRNVSKNIIRFIKAGYIDFMHSFGKKVNFTREDAITAIRELKKFECKIDVWIDHTRSIDNLGNDRTFGEGDYPDSAAYHADLTLNFGIKYVWLGRVTMIAGQSVPINLKTFTNILDFDHPFHSFVNLCKELGKNILGNFGNKKYALHKGNDLVKITTLDDGQKIYEFMRFDNFWRGVGTGADAKGLAYSISEKTLNRLKRNDGYMIVYTHLGRNSGCSQYLCKETQNALRNLANEYRIGNIYVTTTSKLLNYFIVHRYLDWSYDAANGQVKIIISKVEDPIFGPFVPKLSQLAGITFYVPDKDHASIFINEKEIKYIQKNNPDDTGRESITLPLRFLKYPSNKN